MDSPHPHGWAVRPQNEPLFTASTRISARSFFSWVNNCSKWDMGSLLSAGTKEAVGWMDGEWWKKNDKSSTISGSAESDAHHIFDHLRILVSSTWNFSNWGSLSEGDERKLHPAIWKKRPILLNDGVIFCTKTEVRKPSEQLWKCCLETVAVKFYHILHIHRT